MGSNLKFAKYNKKDGWYEYIDPSNDRNELRKKISQLMRDERKRSSLKEVQRKKKKQLYLVPKISINKESPPPQTKEAITTISKISQSRKKMRYSGGAGDNVNTNANANEGGAG